MNDALHAYWRYEYVAAPKPPVPPPSAASAGKDKDAAGGAAGGGTGGGGRFDTLFEDIPNAADERAVHLLWRGATTYLVLNAFPYAPGHILAVPYRPVPDLVSLTGVERADLMDTLALAQKILTDALRPAGFNIGFNLGAAAGAGIPRHLHAHIVPRWDGDNNFMPVIAGARVLSASLDAMWERLRQFCPPNQIRRT
ncbi:MAG: HIT domain-containing protein [Puniceicoccales bacterium]|jgi:ATP adenylyltransferase|nr:HIT domain-containing protein [Puniceicoccales bacterium]